METVELGIGLPRLDAIATSARRAETLGYDFLSTGEHVFFYGPIGNGLISLAAAAGATARRRAPARWSARSRATSRSRAGRQTTCRARRGCG